MTEFRGILFDMDGVLIDSYRSVTDFWLQLAAKHNVTLTAQDFEQKIHGVPLTGTLEDLFPILSTDEYQAIAQQVIAFENGIVYEPVPGVLDLIESLHQYGIPVGLVTSATRDKVDDVLAQFGIAAAFTGIVTADDVRRGKPDPEPYQLGARRIGQAAETCIVFEDSHSGAKAAIAAGAHCIGVGKATRVLLAVGAAHVVPDFSNVKLNEAANDGLTLSLSADYNLQWVGGAD
jgi:sugar-phosphatase